MPTECAFSALHKWFSRY